MPQVVPVTCVALRAFIKLILELSIENPIRFDWSVQGLGMMRFYVGDVGRIHVWDRRLEYPGVSKLHTHSWDLKSTILSGEIRNTRFIERSGRNGGEPYMRQRLACGYNCHLVGDPIPVSLYPQPVERYLPGEIYSQRASEIHFTDADIGTVTFMERKWDGDDKEADVYYEAGTRWGDAKPRKAHAEEVRSTLQAALALMKD